MARHSAAALLLSLLAATAARAAPKEIVSFDDPRGDANGPGTYLPPTAGEFVDGDFDLRHFAVFIDGDEAVFEVTLDAAVRRPDVTQRDNSSDVSLTNGIYLQNIDIYLDTDPSSPTGRADSLPGRRVAFAEGRTWKRVVLLTPQPVLARGVMEEAFGKEAFRVICVEAIQQRGRTLIARVPILALGSAPSRSWGYSVQVSGARWDRSFAILDRIRGTRELDAFTLPVLTVPDSWAFGGGPDGIAHPRVIDVLLPPGADQHQVLGAFDAKAGTFARVPFVYAEPPPPAAQPLTTRLEDTAVTPHASPSVAPAAPAKKAFVELTVAYKAGNMISLSGKSGDLEPMQFGRVLGADGVPIARVVIVQVVEGGLVVSAVEGDEKIVRGAKVRFDGHAGGH